MVQLTTIRTLAILFLVAATAAFAQGPTGPRFQHGQDSSPSLAEPPEFRPPTMPNPPSALPAFPGSAENEKVWKCGKCGAVIGRGPNEPKVERCPSCGVKLTSWFNYYIVGGVGGALLAGLVIVSLIVKATRRR
jgi:DNA-directed RNA polymerase subunit RPC12/RpoP